MAKAFNSKEAKREFDKYRKKVARLNAYIEEVFKKVGSNEVYLDKSSTIICPPDAISLIEEVQTDNPERLLVFRQEFRGTTPTHDRSQRGPEYDTIRIEWQYDKENDEWYAQYYGACFDFEEELRYIKKCVRAGLRYWQSEDPDRFLEQDDDEEGGEA